jgi:hypothetical protein
MTEKFKPAWRGTRERLRKEIEQSRQRQKRHTASAAAEARRIKALQREVQSITPPAANSLEVQLRRSERCFIAYRLKREFSWTHAELAGLFDISPGQIGRMISAGQKHAARRRLNGAQLVDQRQPQQHNPHRAEIDVGHVATGALSAPLEEEFLSALSVRIVNALENLGVHTWADLVALSEREVLKTPGLSGKSLGMLRRELARRGLCLRGSLE